MVLVEAVSYQPARGRVVCSPQPKTSLRSRLKTPFFYLIRLSSKWIMAI